MQKSRLYGCGFGSVLLNKGGTGSLSTYDSPEAYEAITGVKIGAGLGAGLNEKLAKLMVKPISSKKPTISFNL
jgi:hypothetical protein